MNSPILILRDAVHVDHRLLREEGVGRQPHHQVDREADDRPVPGVLDLRHVLQLVVDGLDQRPLAQEDLVRDAHYLPPHVAPQLCDQLDSVDEKPGEKVLADVALVSEEPAEDPLYEGPVPERLAVVHIARGEHEAQEVAFLVADQMQLEAVEPAHGALPALREAPEDPVEMDALVPAHAQGRAVHEAYACAVAHTAPPHEQYERHGHLPLKLDKAVIGDHAGEKACHIPADLVHVKVLEASVPAQVEQYHDGHHLRVGQPAVPVVPPLGPVAFGGETVHLDKSVINPAEVIRLTENIRNFVVVYGHSESFLFGFVLIPNLQKLSLFS